jgi:hypothetical protein
MALTTKEASYITVLGIVISVLAISSTHVPVIIPEYVLSRNLTPSTKEY